MRSPLLVIQSREQLTIINYQLSISNCLTTSVVGKKIELIIDIGGV